MAKRRALALCQTQPTSHQAGHQEPSTLPSLPPDPAHPHPPAVELNRPLPRMTPGQLTGVTPRHGRSALRSPPRTHPASQPPTERPQHNTPRPCWPQQPQAEMEGSRPTAGPREGEALQQPAAQPLSQEPPYLRCLEYLPRMCPEPVHPGVGQLGGDKQGWSLGGRTRPTQTLTLGSGRLSPKSASQNGCLQLAEN